MAGFPFEVRRFQSFDGTSLAYQISRPPPGVADRDDPRPTLFLANGLGGTFSSWRPFCEHFERDYRIVSWDYRGLYASGRPPDPTAVGVPLQARDLDELRRVLNVKSAVFVGWSMGVQVLLEYYRRAPETVAGLVLINGVPGRPFRTALSVPLAEHVLIRPVILLMEGRPRELATMMRWAIARKELIPTMRRLGFLGSAADPELVAELVSEFGRLELGIYGTTLKELGRHDAHDVLPQIQAPVQIITGARDLMTPRSTAEQMKKRISNSRLLIVPDGTHYTPVEAPHVVNPCVSSFLEEIGFRGRHSRGQAQVG